MLSGTCAARRFSSLRLATERDVAGAERQKCVPPPDERFPRALTRFASRVHSIDRTIWRYASVTTCRALFCRPISVIIAVERATRPTEY